MAVKPVLTPSAPPVAGPYSPAVRAGDWLVLAGQLGIDPATGDLAGDVAAQARQSLANIAAILADCGATLDDVAKSTIFLAGSMEHFATVNEIYAAAFGDHRPARTSIAVAALPAGAAVEIEVLVYRPVG